MKKYGLLSKVRRREWENLGQQVHKHQNLQKRQFRADRPNVKWDTDISYIHPKEGVLYLSMIRDLYDNSIVAYKIAIQQTIHLVLDTIRLSMKKEKKRVAAELQFHSDQGFQYISRTAVSCKQERKIFYLLHECMEDSDWDYGVDDLERMILSLDWSCEIQQKNLEWLDENLDSWRMRQRVELMGRMGASKAEVITWLEQHRNGDGTYQPLLRLYEEKICPRPLNWFVKSEIGKIPHGAS